MTDPKIKYDIYAEVEGAQDVGLLASGLEKLDASFDPSLAARAEAVAASLRELGRQQGAVTRFIELKQSTLAAKEAMDAAQVAAQQFGREISQAGSPTRAQAGQMQKLRDAVRASENAHREYVIQLQAQRSQLNESGMGTDRLSEAQVRLRGELSATIAEGRKLLTSHKEQAAALADAARASAGLAEQQAKERAQRDAVIAQVRELKRQRAELAALERASSANLDAELGRLNAAEIAAQKLAEGFKEVGFSRKLLESGGAGLRPLLADLEKLSASLTGGVAARARELSTELASIGTRNDAIGRMRELEASTAKAGAAMRAADLAFASFAEEVGGVAKATADESAQLARLAERARLSRVAFLEHSNALASSTAALRQQGVAVDQVAAKNREHGRTAVASAGQQVQANKQVSQSVDDIGKKLDGLRNISIGAILGGQGAQAIKSVAETADAFDNLAARIKLAVGEGGDFTAAMQGVYDVAKRTHAPLEATGTLFTRLMVASTEMGLSTADAQQQSLALAETINQAVQLSGASAQASDAMVTQLIQGLQSGVVRGEEFNSVMEQGPRLAQALAAGIGTTTGQLRVMASEGRLSTAVIIEALKNQSGVIQQEFSKLPTTVGRAIEDLGTQWTKFIGELNQSTGATSYLAEGIGLLANNLDSIARIAAVAGSVLTASLAVKGAAAMRTLVIEAAAAAGASNLLAASLNKIPAMINVTVAATGFEVGWQIGEMLNENSEYARKLGVFLVGFFENLINDLQLLKEAGEALFTDDTVGQAFERYRQRGKEMDGIFSDMWKEAEKAPAKVSSAANAAAQATAQMAHAAQTAGGSIQASSAAAASGVGGISHAAETAQAAFDSLAKKAGSSLPSVSGIAAAQAEALSKLASNSSSLALKLGTELPAAIAKLSGNELENFRTAFIHAFGQAESQSKLLRSALDEIGRRAAEALGVDVVKASGRLGESFIQAEQNLSILIRSLDGLNAAGYDTGQMLKEAISKMIEGARSETEIAALRGRISALGQAGQVSKMQLIDMLDAASARADKLKEGINSTAEALAVFGLKSQAELTKVADNFGRAWAQIKDDTSISLEQKQKAFAQYSEAVIAANKGVVTEQLKQEAALVKIALQAGKTGVVFEDAMHGVAGAAGGVNSQLEETRRLMRAIYDQQVANASLPPSAINGSNKSFADQVANREQDRMSQRIKEGRAPTAEDNTAMQSLLQKMRDGTLTAADLPTARANLSAALANQAMMQQAWPGTFSLEGQRSTDLAAHQARLIVEALGGSQSGGASAGLSVSKRVQVDLNVGGNTSTLYGDESSADALVRALEQGKRSMGGR